MRLVSIIRELRHSSYEVELATLAIYSLLLGH
ncbi:hypothetical protein SAMN05216288_0659 [Pseudomonas punonensis]|uniref:Uncharacterized protein n=1 Tax=Phytopseudomonas punonensis TaxID=1220495 RepID=A0A1M7P5F1_9GAMM|nr:hypothetical protein SAMN05216288_0659 [Pseudomonas punonensis]